MNINWVSGKSQSLTLKKIVNAITAKQVVIISTETPVLNLQFAGRTISFAMRYSEADNGFVCDYIDGHPDIDKLNTDIKDLLIKDITYGRSKSRQKSVNIWFEPYWGTNPIEPFTGRFENIYNVLMTFIGDGWDIELAPIEDEEDYVGNIYINTNKHSILVCAVDFSGLV